MSDFDKMLERVAVRLFALSPTNPSLHDYDEVLRETVLPLLEAGQELRAWIDRQENRRGNFAREHYDAAKQAAMEGRCSTDQK